MLAAGALAALFFASMFRLLGGLQVLTEAREYIANAGWVRPGDLSQLSEMLWPRGQILRLTSMYGFFLMRALCGHGAPCINAVQLAILALAGFALQVHAYQVFRRVPVALAIGALWLFSLPVLDAAAWQATNHDKLAALFSFATLAVAMHYAPMQRSARTLALSNALVAIGLVLAFNAKESAFFLAPLLPLQSLLFGRSPRDLAKISLPLLLAAVYLLLYFLRMPEDWRAHVLSGSAVQNAPHYLFHLVNTSRNPSGGLALLVYGTLVAGAVAIAARRLRGTALPGDAGARTLLYGLCFWSSALAVALRARHPSVFYMLIPLAGLLFAVSAALGALLGDARWPAARARVAAALALLLVAGLGWRYSTHLSEGSTYRVRLAQSRNLASTGAEIRRSLPPDDGEQFVLAHPAGIENFFYFLRGSIFRRADRFLLDFVFESDGPYRIGYLPYQSLEEIASRPASRRGHLIVIDRNYELVHLQRKPAPEP
jgi:hypothetical protein